MNEKYKLFEEIVYIDSENKRQIGKVYGFHDASGDIIIKDLKTQIVNRISPEKIEGQLEF